MGHVRQITTEDIKHMSMSDYAAFRAKLMDPNSVKFVKTYEYCKQQYIETGEIRWLSEMIDLVSP